MGASAALPRVLRPEVTPYAELDWNVGIVRGRWTRAGGPAVITIEEKRPIPLLTGKKHLF